MRPRFSSAPSPTWCVGLAPTTAIERGRKSRASPSGMLFHLAELRVAPVERRAQAALVADAPERLLLLGGCRIEDAPQVGGVGQGAAQAHHLEGAVERLLLQPHCNRRDLGDQQ